MRKLYIGVAAVFAVAACTATTEVRDPVPQSTNLPSPGDEVPPGTQVSPGTAVRPGVGSQGGDRSSNSN